jgi:outer membrane protein assembly factor BamB
MFAGPVVAAPGDLLLTLTSPDPQLVPSFGDALAVVDGDILVGEPLWMLPTTRDVGRAYLFDGQTGALRFTFDEPQPERNGRTFGKSVAGGDGSIFIARDDRVHAYDAITGQPRFQIDPPDGDGVNFAWTIAYGNGSLLVGEPSKSSGGMIAVGQMHLFDATTGQFQFTIPHPEPGDRQAFSGGDRIAVFGNKVAAGSITYNASAGGVWVFDRLTGELLFPLHNPNPESPILDWYSWSIAGNDEIIAVSADEDSTNGVGNSGTVYLFDAETGALRHTLFSPRAEIDGEFGRQVALTPAGDVLVGAFGETVNGLKNAGRAYLFDGETGGLLLEFANPEGGIGTFGWTVAATESQILIGAPASQMVYVYETIPEPASIALVAAVLVVALAVGAIRARRKKSVISTSPRMPFADFAPFG